VNLDLNLDNIDGLDFDVAYRSSSRLACDPSCMCKYGDRDVVPFSEFNDTNPKRRGSDYDPYAFGHTFYSCLFKKQETTQVT